MTRRALNLFILFIFFSSVLNAQDFQNTINLLGDNLKTVETKKGMFSQVVNVVESGVIQFVLTETKSDGETKTTKYVFNPSDIDPSAIKSIVKKDLILVQLKTKNFQKRIKSINDDKIVYVKNLYFYAQDINNSRSIESIFKESITQAHEQINNRLNLSTLDEHISWLQSNVVSVNNLTQSLELNRDFPGSFSITRVNTNSKSEDIEKVEINLSVLEPSKVKLNLVNNVISVSFETINRFNSIKYFENNEQKLYKHGYSIICRDIEHARDMKLVLEKAIPLAKTEFTNSIPEINTAAEAINSINNLLGEFAVNEIKINQSFSNDCSSEFSSNYYNNKAVDENFYAFNFSDIEKKSINFFNRGMYLQIDVKTKDFEKFINHKLDSEQKDYVAGFKIYVPSIEAAIIIKQILINTTNICSGEEKSEEVSFSSKPSNISSSASSSETNKSDTSNSTGNCKPSKTAKDLGGNTIDLYGGTIRGGGFASNDKSNYAFYIGQIEGGKKGTAAIATLFEPVEIKSEYDYAVNNFLNENNLNNSVLEITVNGKRIKIPATRCTQKPTKFLGSISGYSVIFEGDIMKEQIEELQNYDIKKFRLVIGGHPYERTFKKSTTRIKNLRKAFNCINMDNLFEVKKKKSTEMNLDEVAKGDFSKEINGKWLLQESNGVLVEYKDGKVVFSKMGLKTNEGSYKIVGVRIIYSTDNGNSIGEISMFLKDMMIIKEKGVEKTYERVE